VPHRTSDSGLPAAVCRWRQAVPNTPPRLHSLMSVMAPPTALPRAAPGAPAEEQAAAFEDDPRVYFDTQSARWRLEEGDAEFEYEPSKAVWIPVVSLPPPNPAND
jgi:hypothetical protein